MYFVSKLISHSQVVFGAANYSQLLPSHSYIDTRNFSSPKELAEYLNQVGNDRLAYNAYFEWKKSKKSVVLFDLRVQRSNYICPLANKLLSTPPEAKSIKTNLSNWWYEESNCRNESQKHLH
jgi:alpha-1,3-fucosyltransferase